MPTAPARKRAAKKAAEPNNATTHGQRDIDDDRLSNLTFKQLEERGH